MCDYHGHDFGANYSDACCIEGYLWDLDSCDEPGGGLSVGGDIHCPQCNSAAHAWYFMFDTETRDFSETGVEVGEPCEGLYSRDGWY